jgi:hypothetical protein
LNNQFVLQEEQCLECKNHLSDLQYELEKSRSKETKLERSLADAIGKLEDDRLKFHAHDIKHDPDAKPTNANNNTVMIPENKVVSHLLTFDRTVTFVCSLPLNRLVCGFASRNRRIQRTGGESFQ